MSRTGLVPPRGRRRPPCVLVLCSSGTPPPAVHRALAEAGLAMHVEPAVPSRSGAAAPGDAWRALNASMVIAVAPPAAEPAWVHEIVAHAGALPVVVATPARDVAWERAVRRAGVTEVVTEDDASAIGAAVAHLTRPGREAVPGPRPRALAPAVPLAGLSVVLGLVVLAAWWADAPAGRPGMKANSAVMFILLGTAVVLAARQRAARVVRVLCAGVALIAAATAFEDLTGWSSGLDTLLAADPHARWPGRPPMHTAITFLLGAGAVSAYGSGVSAAPGRMRERAAGALLFAYTMVVLLAIVAWVYGVEVVRGSSPLTGMAPQTAGGLCLLTVAIPALAPDMPPFSWLLARGEAGILFRRLLPAALIIPPVLGGLWLPLLGTAGNDVAVGVALFATSMVAVFTALVVWVVELIEEAGERRARADAALRDSEVRFRQLGTLAPVGMQEFDAAGWCTSVNPRWTDITGLAPRVAWGTGWLAAVHPEDRDRVAAGLREVLQEGRELRLDHRLVRHDGTLAWVSARIARLSDADGRGYGALGTVMDITPLKQAQADAAAREGLLRGLLDHWPGVVLVEEGDDARVAMLNRLAAAALRMEPDAVIGRSLYALLPAAAAAAERERDAEIRRTGEALTYEETIEGRSYSVTKFPLPVAPGDPSRLAAIAVDITERIRQEALVQELADRDPLTGLANRRSFARDLERHVQEVARYGAGGSLLLLDLDDFKRVNDTLGHSVGDELLVLVAQLLKRSLREVDIVARLGGDEFAVLLPKATRIEAEAVADKLVTVIRAQAEVSRGERTGRVTASLGISCFDGRMRTGEEMLIEADLAMYGAKDRGRDRWNGLAPRGPIDPS